MGKRTQGHTMTEKSVSVIVTNYNHKQYIRQALDSIQKQTYKNIAEIIIVDDGSTDGSQELIKEIENHALQHNSRFPIKVILLSENKGKWNALNTGIREAKGDLITLQDADDVSCAQRIERQMIVLETTNTLHNLCGFFHCYSQEDVDNNKISVVPEKSLPPIMSSVEVTRFVFLGRKTPGINHYYTGPFEVHGATCLFYRQLWEHGMKFLPGNMGLRCQRAEDSDFNTKCTLLLQKTSLLLEKHYCYRRGTTTNGAFLEGL